MGDKTQACKTSIKPLYGSVVESAERQKVHTLVECEVHRAQVWVRLSSSIHICVRCLISAGHAVDLASSFQGLSCHDPQVSDLKTVQFGVSVDLTRRLF